MYVSDDSRRYPVTIILFLAAALFLSGCLAVNPVIAAKGIVSIDERGMFRDTDGKPFIVMGYGSLHLFQPRSEDPAMWNGWIESAWCNIDRAPLEETLRYLKDNGINTLRIGLTVYSDGMAGDLGGRANPMVIEALERYLSVADSLGMKVIPVFYWGPYGHYQLFNAAYDSILYDKEPMAWFCDREAIKLQKAFIRDVVTRFKNDQRVLAWELMNEIWVYYDFHQKKNMVTVVDSPHFAAWSGELSGYIKELGVKNLVKLDFSAGAAIADNYDRKAGVDILGYRAYPVSSNSVSDYGTYCSAYARYGLVFKNVCIAGELGTDKSALFRRIATRDAVWMSLLAGAPGVIGWDGLWTDPDEFRIAAEVLNSIDWAGFRRATPPVLIRVRGDGKDLDDLRRYDEYFQRAGYDFDVVVKKDAGDEVAGKYEAVIDTEEFTRPRWWEFEELDIPEIKSKPVFKLSEGYYGTFLLDGNRKVMVLYARNMQGKHTFGGFRMKVDTPLNLTVSLPGTYNYKLYDLDQKKVVAQDSFKDELKLARPAAQTDYALHITRGGR